jgi:hypothetical protein
MNRDLFSAKKVSGRINGSQLPIFRRMYKKTREVSPCRSCGAPMETGMTGDSFFQQQLSFVNICIIAQLEALMP